MSCFQVTQFAVKLYSTFADPIQNQCRVPTENEAETLNIDKQEDEDLQVSIEVVIASYTQATISYSMLHVKKRAGPEMRRHTHDARYMCWG